jgi:hypothetical protein
MQRGLMVVVLTSIVTLGAPVVAQPLLSPDMPVDLLDGSSSKGSRPAPKGGLSLTGHFGVRVLSLTGHFGVRVCP